MKSSNVGYMIYLSTTGSSRVRDQPLDFGSFSCLAKIDGKGTRQGRRCKSMTCLLLLKTVDVTVGCQPDETRRPHGRRCFVSRI